MKLKRNRLKTYYHKVKSTKKDKEGGTYEVYGAAVSFSGEMWPAAGKIQAEMYGDRLSYIRNVRINGKYVITTDRDGQVHYVYPSGLDIMESDGLCLYVSASEEPDYKIISAKPYSFLRLEAEKRK
ncbi:hypothetical protein [Diplocloster modestus]|uniref:Uncharacterized protein n=1 Tax=Diplocloster modestus TaxID=2850322 RepID=A0ABS6K2L8_9FIRM|nr:hypothetical protein [Diplocloster modestus]MBU9724437.1 hypothetical protein [Diplocloster modestus]